MLQRVGMNVMPYEKVKLQNIKESETKVEYQRVWINKNSLKV